MITACKLAGYFAAHAIWCVSDGETLTPMLAYTTVENERRMDRLVSDDLDTSVAFGRRKLQSNEMDADDAALLFDGFVTLGKEKVDAIVIEIRAYFSPSSEAVIAIPYTPKPSGKFLVHKPKVLVWEDCEDFDIRVALQSFFAGVNAHEKGSEIWKGALDESK
jgi:hypothetical protein